MGFLKELAYVAWQIIAVAIILGLSVAVPVVLVKLMYKSFLIRRSDETVACLAHYEERVRWRQKRDRANDSYDSVYGWGVNATIHHKAYSWEPEKYADCVYSYWVDGQEYELEAEQPCPPAEELRIWYRRNRPEKCFARTDFVNALIRLALYLVIYTVVNVLTKLVVFYPLFFLLLGAMLVYIIFPLVKKDRK